MTNCPICNQSFSRRDAMRRHVRNVHDSVKDTDPSQPLTMLLFVLSRRKKSKQHALDDNLLFKAIIQYALAHILQKSTILWTERQQPFLMHSITFSLI